jgi:polysaccharide export outer membrane protein
MIGPALRSAVVLHLLVPALTAPLAPLSAQSADSEAVAATLAPGDSVRITVWRDPQLSGSFVVGTDGAVVHPLYRSVRVGGVPAATATENVRSFLVGLGYKPDFTLESLHQVAVVGEVSRPGLYAVPSGTTVAEAVARAGGATEAGRLDRVRVLRRQPARDPAPLVLDLTGARGMVGATIRSGDQIVIGRRGSFMRDWMLPALTVVGSLASLGIFIDRAAE